ncbi:recombinase family protein [Kitasatospora sp. NPDC091335]|uniref:recombinase family protein n=1 Tax=Kitasatospora sp. NPDC091335 TaxID=3364085 RepID=UPI0038205A39
MTKETKNLLAGTVFTETLRGVRCVRLSVLTDETTSPERQRDAADHVAGELRIDFGQGDALREAVDLDVSASKTSPWERPQLLRWLSDPDAYDALVFWRFDRAIRSMQDMYALANWARKQRKVLVFAEGLGGGRQVFDFRNAMDPMAELQLFMLAFAAQFEAQSISDRVSGAQAALRAMPLRWRGGGRPPYGYMPAPMPEEFGGKGWTLVPDPDAVKVIERIIRELLEGRTVSAIAIGLNADNVPTPRDHWAVKNGRETGGKTGGVKGLTRDRFKWTPGVITRILRNETLLGWKMHKGKPVRDGQGNPVMAALNPIMTREEFDQVGAVLDSRSTQYPSERTDSNALLLAVVHCAGCGGRMYFNRQESSTAQHPTYGCGHHARGVKCEQPAYIRHDWVDDFVTSEFLRLAGPIPVTRTVEIPGYDPQPEINSTMAEYESHLEEKGKQKSKSALAMWEKRRDALDSRLIELESREKTEPQRIVTATGRTYADEWKEADTTQRRGMLVDAGVRLDVRKGTRGGWRKLDTRRVDFSMSGELDLVAEELDAISRQAESDVRGDRPAAHSKIRTAAPVAA